MGLSLPQATPQLWEVLSLVKQLHWARLKTGVTTQEEAQEFEAAVVTASACPRVSMSAEDRAKH